MKIKGIIRQINVRTPMADSWGFGNEVPETVITGPPEATVEMLFTGDNLDELIDALKMGEEIEFEVGTKPEPKTKSKKPNKWRLIRL